MLLKASKNKVVSLILALSLAILLAGMPTIIPTTYAGDCTTQTSGSC